MFGKDRRQCCRGLCCAYSIDSREEKSKSGRFTSKNKALCSPVNLQRPAQKRNTYSWVTTSLDPLSRFETASPQQMCGTNPKKEASISSFKRVFFSFRGHINWGSNDLQLCICQAIVPSPSQCNISTQTPRTCCSLVDRAFSLGTTSSSISIRKIIHIDRIKGSNTHTVTPQRLAPSWWVVELFLSRSVPVEINTIKTQKFTFPLQW